MKKILSFLLALVFVIGCIQVTVPAADNNNPNLISNGDFETAGAQSRYAQNWETENDYRRVEKDNHGYVMEIGGSSREKSCYHDSITLKADTYYCYSAKIFRYSNTGAVYVDLWTEDKKTLIEGSRVGISADESGRWVTVSCIFNSGEHTVVKPHLATSGTGATYYTSYFDDVTLTELTFPAEATIGTPRVQFDAATDSTRASFAATDNGLYITRLSQYITEPQEISLVSRISDKEVTWKYNEYEARTISNGTEHIVTFRSSDEKYELKAVITGRTGDGPIEFNQYITGSEGISIAYSDIISANIAVQADGEATLHRFSRSRINSSSDPYFSKGVLKDKLMAGSSVFSSVENYYNTKIDGEDSTGSILPYQVLDINGNHGVYFGYYWSFGKMLVRMNDSNEVAFTTYLAESSEKGRIVRDADVELSIPGFFIGTYAGSVDDGSNQMKDWFWDHKMTRTLNENENEPYIEIGMIGGTVASVDKLFEIWRDDLANYANILKLDRGWSVPLETDSPKYSENNWIPNGTYTNADGERDLGLYDAIREHIETDRSENNIYLSLYMPNTFNDVKIGTKEGREEQLQALKDRMSPDTNDYGIGYEYWRSDYDVERSYNYDDHESLLYILDEMIDYSDDFRYEHCMGGGSLKDFTTLERMTFMTTEDTALPLNHRMSLYANTYMINPLQLKADISMGISKNTDDDPILESRLPGYTDEAYVKYALRTGMLGAMNLTFNEAGYCYGNNLDIIKEHYDLYNNTHREILRNTDVYHILKSPDGWDYDDWDGIEYYNPELNKGVVQLFKENASAPNTRNIVLDGLDEDTMYALTFIDRTEQNTVMSGAKLMSEGITITGMNGQHASEIIYIEPYTANDVSPVIISAVAINETQYKITTSEYVTVTKDGTVAWALYHVADGKIVNNKDNRFDGTISPIDKPTTEFIWTITEKDSIAEVFDLAKESGYQVYFGINGPLETGVITAKRAHGDTGDGFGVTHDIGGSSQKAHAISVEAYVPNTITSVALIDDTYLEIEFAYPIVSFNGSVLLGVLNDKGTNWTEPMIGLAATSSMIAELKDGKLICSLTSDKTVGDVNYGKNLTKIVKAITEEYGDQRAGIMIMEPDNQENGTKFNSGYLERVADQYGRSLKKTSTRTTGSRNTRDVCAHPIAKSVLGVVKIGETRYDTLAAAMEKATANDTIVLLDDVTVNDRVFILKSGVALDLNGNTLTVNNFLLTFDDVLQVIDSQNGVGKLVITKKNVCGDFADNNYLPLYDDGGYRFFAYEFCHLEEETGDDDKVKYWVGLGFANKAAYNLLISEDNADVDFGVNMTITKSDGFDEGLNWVFSDALMDEFVQKNVNSSKRMAVILTISGMTRLGDAQYTTKAILRSSVVDLAKNMDMMAQ